jgi:hypothetical protein
MPYRLILSEPNENGTKAVGENVFLDNLSRDFKVFLLYYSGAVPDEELEARLRSLGNATGDNLFVNIGRLSDPNYQSIQKKFGIKPLPALVMTGIEELASARSEAATAYVRLDNKALLRSPDATIECLQKLFNLYVGGNLAEAMREGKRDQFLARLKQIVLAPLKGIRNFVAERDISVSVIDGTLTLQRGETRSIRSNA